MQSQSPDGSVCLPSSDILPSAKQVCTERESVLSFLPLLWPYLRDVIERRKHRFTDRLIGPDHFEPELRSTTYFAVLSVLS